MKVLHLSSTGTKGGAGVATGRLHASLRRLGVDSKMLSLEGIFVDEKSGLQPTSWPDFYRALDLELAQSAFVDADRTAISNTLFSLGLPGPALNRHPEVLAADIIHLHWINGLLGIPAIGELMAAGKPVVWTIHDQWPFTGGCHYSAGCTNYSTGCKSCPQLRAAANRLPGAVLSDKMTLWTAAKSVTLVVLTKWMEICVKQSRLFPQTKTRHIPNGLDLATFSPVRRDAARRKLGIPPDTIVFLFASQSIKEHRKGYLVLKEALALALTEPAFRQAVDTGRITFACIGHDTDENAPVPMRYWGWISDESEMADCYAAADVFLAPALEDNLPNTVVESLACGTPVIGSSAGGIPEMVIPGQTGAIFPTANADSLARCLRDVFDRPEQYKNMRASCRTHAEDNYSDRRNAEAMARLYEGLLAEQSPRAGHRPAEVSAGPYGPAVKAFLSAPGLPLPPGSLQILATDRRKEIQGTHDYIMAIEADRAARLKVIEEMQRQLADHGAARQAAEAKVAELTQSLQGTCEYLASAEADRTARLAAIEKMQQQLAEHGAARQTAEARAAELAQALQGTRDHLSSISADCAARLQAIESMQLQLEEHGRLRHAAESRVAELERAAQGANAHLLRVEADRQARLDAINLMQGQLEAHGKARHAAEARVAELEQALAGTADYLAIVEADRAARLEAILTLQKQLDSRGPGNPSASTDPVPS